MEPARPDQQLDEPGIRFGCGKRVGPRDQHPDRPPGAPQPWSLARFRILVSKSRQLPRGAQVRPGSTAGKDAQRSSTSRQLPVISLSSPIPVPECRATVVALLRQARLGRRGTW